MKRGIILGNSRAYSKTMKALMLFVFFVTVASLAFGGEGTNTVGVISTSGTNLRAITRDIWEYCSDLLRVIGPVLQPLLRPK